MRFLTGHIAIFAPWPAVFAALGVGAQAALRLAQGWRLPIGGKASARARPRPSWGHPGAYVGAPR